MRKFRIFQILIKETANLEIQLLRQRPNCAFNADANSRHAFGILMAAVGTLRPAGFGAR
jgi:hypothetical protein